MKTKDDTVSINKEVLIELLGDSARLTILLENGVDNWEGYGFASEDIAESIQTDLYILGIEE